MWNRNKMREVNKMRKERKGQSILEYVIVLTVIVAAIALAATTLIKPSMNKAFNDIGATINAASNRLPK